MHIMRAKPPRLPTEACAATTVPFANVLSNPYVASRTRTSVKTFGTFSRQGGVSSFIGSFSAVISMSSYVAALPPVVIMPMTAHLCRPVIGAHFTEFILPNGCRDSGVEASDRHVSLVRRNVDFASHSGRRPAIQSRAASHQPLLTAP